MTTNAADSAGSAGSNDSQYIPVRLNTLRGNDVVQFDLYIQVGERLIHYLRKEDPFDAERINSLKAKGVRKLFIPLDSEESYLKYLDVGILSLSDSKTSVNDRANVAHTSLMNLAGNAVRSVESKNQYADMEGRVGKIVDFVRSEKSSALNMLKQSGVASDELQHASNVVTLSLMLASKVGVVDSKDILNLSVGALIHDIGKAKMNLNFLLPREKMSVGELALYQTHCLVGAEKVKDKPYINTEIQALIYNHEEIGDAAGFPEKKRITTLPLPQQVLNLCNEYDRSCTVFQLTPEQGIKRFFVERIGLFPLPLINALKEVLHVSG